MRENTAERRWVKAISNRKVEPEKGRRNSKEIGRETRDLCNRQDEELAWKLCLLGTLQQFASSQLQLVSTKKMTRCGKCSLFSNVNSKIQNKA